MAPDKPTNPISTLTNRPLTPHPSVDKLELYALGRLSEPDVEEIEIHLLMCEACQKELDTADQYVAAMKGALAEAPLQKVDAAQPKSWMSWRPMPAFSLAFVMLAVIIVGYNVNSLRPTAPASLILRSVRGANEIANGPGNTPLNLTILSEQLKVDFSYRVEIVNADGASVWKGTPEGGMIKTDKALGAGSYWVRLRDANGNLVQEYGLSLK
jgi:hypothetical protein